MSRFVIDFVLQEELRKDGSELATLYPVCDSARDWCDVVAYFLKIEDADAYCALLNWVNPST